MLIAFGLRVFFSTVGQGVFHCPRCVGDRQYRLRAGRRFFTMFFVPVIPLTRVGEHVQCMACQARFHTDVLGLPTAGQMAAALPEGMRTAAVTMLRAGGSASPAARQRAVEAIRGAGANGYGPATLDADLGQPVNLGAGALDQVGSQFTPEAREWFFAQVVRLLLSTGRFLPLSGRPRRRSASSSE